MGALVALALAAPAAGAAMVPNERVSVSSEGAEANCCSHEPVLSADGRFVAFTSGASNLVAGDDRNGFDVFVRDRQGGRTERVSVASDGTEANAGSFEPAISADGRFVAFRSAASNLVAGDSNGTGDVFVHDRETGVTERVSVASDGSQANSRSWSVGISADGRFVAFMSFASSLVAGDTNSSQDAFVHDRQAGTTERVSVGPGGAQVTTWDPEPRLETAISGDGRFVAFTTDDPALAAADEPGLSWDIFVRDRQKATTERVGSGVGRQMFSADGRFVIGAGGGVYDRQTGTSEPVAVGFDGTPGGWVESAISADGRFVAFWSRSSNLVRGDTNGSLDFFVRDRQAGTTERVSVAVDGGQTTTRFDLETLRPAISADGRVVAFVSDAPNLVAGDGNGDYDVFVRELATTPAPTVTTPWFGFASAFPLAATSPVLNRVQWSVSEPAAICLHELEHSVDGGAFVPVALASPTATAVVRAHGFGHGSRYRLRATDCAGRTSAWRTSQAFAPGVVDGDGASYTGSWSAVADGDGFNGTLSRSLSAGDSASYTVTARRLAWIAPRGPDRGTAKVYIDGAEVATVNLSARSLTPRQVVWQRAWPTTRPHTIRIETVSGRVDIDALAYLSTDIPVRDPADTTAPTVTQPTLAFVSPFPLQASSPVLNQLRWSASDASAICLYELEQSVDHGAFVPVALPSLTATSIVRAHTFGRSYGYRLRATDCAGNSSAWRGAGLDPRVLDGNGNGLTYAGAWSAITDSDSFNGTLTRSLSAGDSVSYTVTTRRLAWIAPRGPDRGTAKVYIDGAEVATVNLSARSPTPRSVVWQKAWGALTGPHTIRIEAASGRVDIDALARL